MVPTPTSAGSPVSGTGEQVSSGQTHVQNYLQPLLERIQGHEIDPSSVIAHRMSLDTSSANTLRQMTEVIHQRFPGLPLYQATSRRAQSNRLLC
ncbi:MAG TPA: hypothetical protein VKV20_12135 [Ktedonobacteraceae bacterium]|jgi:hypothetical protein|nr:hypothetical protein [Ktedonobacteraceae bacterium]